MVNTDFLEKPNDPIYATLIEDKAFPARDQLCYVTQKAVENGVWQDINPLNVKLPIFICQLIIAMAFTRLFLIICKNATIRQPPFVAELFAGLLLSPTTIGYFLKDTIFSPVHAMTLETVGNFGLAYHLFLLGLDMDVRTISRMDRKPLTIGIAGALVPFTLGALFYASTIHKTKENSNFGSVYWGVALSVTSLAVTADSLGKLKLLHSELGRIAISSTLVNEILSWVLLVIASAVSGSHSHAHDAYFSLLCAIVFVIISVFLIRPAILWVIRRTRGSEDYSQKTVCIVLAMVLACGLITDACGLTSMVGAFVFGLIIPQEVLGRRFLVVLQSFVSDLFMPLYYASVGLRFDFGLVFKDKNGLLLSVEVALLCFLTKLIAMLAISFCYGTSYVEGVSLAILVNTKGLLSVIALTTGRDQLELSPKGYSVMIITILLMTTTISPIMRMLHRPKKSFLPSKKRALQRLKPDAELRVLACVHELQTVPGITALLSISNATRRSPICVFALHLIQLTKHITALLIVQSPSRGDSQGSRRGDEKTDQIIAAFEKIEEENPLLSVHQLTTMSSFATMHEDISRIAEDKRAALIILPFHKRQTIHNKMEDMNPAYKDVNHNVLANAPCSVGILVDRGFGKSAAIQEEDTETIHQVAMIYIGGPDDREALAYAWRMAGHPSVSLTVLRFLPGENATNIEPYDFVEDGDKGMSMTRDMEAEKELDEAYLNDFKRRTANYNLVTYLEKASSNGAQTVGAVRSMAENFHLFIVGRGVGMLSPLKAGLDDWSEYPELGSIGDLLVTSDISSTASVLVVQQYSGLRPAGDGLLTPDSSHDFKLSPASIEPLMKQKLKNEDF